METLVHVMMQLAVKNQSSHQHHAQKTAVESRRGWTLQVRGVLCMHFTFSDDHRAVYYTSDTAVQGHVPVVGGLCLPAAATLSPITCSSAGATSSASHQSSTLRASLEEELEAAGPTPSPPVDVPGGGFRQAAEAGQLPHFAKEKQQQYTRLVSALQCYGVILSWKATSFDCMALLKPAGCYCTMAGLFCS